MADRVIKVNAYTSFDLLDGAVEGHGWEESGLAVLDVTTDRADSEVRLRVELDNTDVDRLPAHAETVSLSAAEARELAAELESYADRVDDDGSA